MSEYKTPNDCLMYILSDFDDDKERLREFCDAIIADLESNDFIVIHKDNLKNIIEKSVEKHVSNENPKFPKGAYYWG